MKNTNILFIISAIILGVLTRTVWHLAPNLEFVTALSIVSVIFLKNFKQQLLMLFSIMFISDLIIGNTSIFLFTWSAFLFTILLTHLLKKIHFSENKFFQGLLTSSLAGILGTAIFFLWTNFGVVLLTDLYTKNLSGLMQSYLNALPFLRPQLSGNLFLVPLIYVVSYGLFKMEGKGIFSKLKRI
ncbi:MAG: DUF6580 family putative transport protein [bacterium]